MLQSTEFWEDRVLEIAWNRCSIIQGLRDQSPHWTEYSRLRGVCAILPGPWRPESSVYRVLQISWSLCHISQELLEQLAAAPCQQRLGLPPPLFLGLGGCSSVLLSGGNEVGPVLQRVSPALPPFGGRRTMFDAIDQVCELIILNVKHLQRWNY